MTPAAAVLAALGRRGETLATAESLTGGMVGAALTTVPGSSAVYLGGVISYATRLKSTLAGVGETTLSEAGPVAAITAQEMALGVARICDADWGLSTTGVAGPDPQGGHRVGEVYLGMACRTTGDVWSERLDLEGDRASIREAVTLRALDLLLLRLQG